MDLLLIGVVQSLPNILKLLGFFATFILMFSLFAMKIFKGEIYRCDLTDPQIINKWDCFDYGGNWINRDLNYDNIVNSFISLFQIVSCEGWSILMFIIYIIF